MEADCDLVDSPEYEENIGFQSTSSKWESGSLSRRHENEGRRICHGGERNFIREDFRDYTRHRDRRSWSPPRDYREADNRHRHGHYHEDRWRDGDRGGWSDKPGDRYDERKRRRESGDRLAYSRDSPVSKHLRPASRNSRHSSHSNDDNSNLSSSQSFEDMARGLLAGTLRDDVAAPAATFGVTTTQHVPGVTTTRHVPMFGAPVPGTSRMSDFDSLMYQQQQEPVSMFDLPPQPKPPHPVIQDIERDQEDMTSRVLHSLAHLDQKPSRIIRLDRGVSTHELTQIYQTISQTPCEHMECHRLYRGASCFFFPKRPIGLGDTYLEFLTEIRAAIFKKVLLQHNIGSSFQQSLVTMIDLKETSRVVKEEEKVGIPRRYQQESYLLCTVVMDLMSSSSVEHGTVSAPFKISIYSGQWTH